MNESDARDGSSVFVDQRTNMTQTAYMVIARLHNVSHVFIKSQLAIDGNCKYADWLWTRHEGVSKMYRSNGRGGILKLRDLLPFACDQCLSFCWVEQKIVVEVNININICSIELNEMAK